MRYSEPIIPIPTPLKHRYQILRVFLYVIVILATILFALRVLFPTLLYSFNFKTPSSSKNNLLDPRSPENAPRTNGKIESDGTLVADAGVVGTFSRAEILVSLEKNSPLPESLELILRRSYRSFLLPTGLPLTDFPDAALYKIDETYYALQGGTLYPFVSESAYLSQYPADFASPESPAFLLRFPVSESWLGFRVGSIVSFADGVFLITSETEMRPIGSADIFLALGYRFEDVRPASGEEIGIYKRGRIFLLGGEHPDGTLLLDQDTNTYYLIEKGMKRPFTESTNAIYRDFILTRQTPILVSNESSETQANCVLEPSLFGQTFACETTLTSFPLTFGPDFEIHLQNGNTEIDMNTLQISFVTEKSSKNMLTLLSQIKERLLTRFGLSNE